MSQNEVLTTKTYWTFWFVSTNYNRMMNICDQYTGKEAVEFIH